VCVGVGWRRAFCCQGNMVGVSEFQISGLTRDSRNARKANPSSPDESNVKVPGSGAGAVTVPPLKPLVLTEQVSEMVLSPAKVTSPVDAKSLPQLSVTPVVVMLVPARTFPKNVPERVAELLISQNTPASAASKSPGVITTDPEEVSALPMKTQLGSVTSRVFVRVRVPVKSAAEIL